MFVVHATFSSEFDRFIYLFIYYYYYFTNKEDREEKMGQHSNLLMKKVAWHVNSDIGNKLEY